MTCLARGVIFLTVAILLCLNRSAAGEDLELFLLRTYGVFEGGERGGVLYLNDKEVRLKPGEVTRIEITEYNPLDGINPDLIDVVATIRNKNPRPVADIEVIIAVSPKVANLIFLKGLAGSGWDPSTADKEATERTAEWFAPILLLRKTVDRVPGRGNVEVVFEKIDLKGIIQRYVARKLWPTELRIEASVEPKGREDSFRNNTMTRYFRIKLPPY